MNDVQARRDRRAAILSSNEAIRKARKVIRSHPRTAGGTAFAAALASAFGLGSASTAVDEDFERDRERGCQAIYRSIDALEDMQLPPRAFAYLAANTQAASDTSLPKDVGVVYGWRLACRTR